MRCFRAKHFKVRNKVPMQPRRVAVECIQNTAIMGSRADHMQDHVLEYCKSITQENIADTQHESKPVTYVIDMSLLYAMLCSFISIPIRKGAQCSFLSFKMQQEGMKWAPYSRCWKDLTGIVNISQACRQLSISHRLTIQAITNT